MVVMFHVCVCVCAELIFMQVRWLLISFFTKPLMFYVTCHCKLLNSCTHNSLGPHIVLSLIYQLLKYFVVR